MKIVLNREDEKLEQYKQKFIEFMVYFSSRSLECLENA